MKPWTTILRPHRSVLTLAFFAAIGEALADILQPWPLKIVLDNVLHHHGAKGNAWLNNLVVSIAGTDQWAVLKLATLAALLIAVFGAICSYAETSPHHQHGPMGDPTISASRSIRMSIGCRSPITTTSVPAI